MCCGPSSAMCSMYSVVLLSPTIRATRTLCALCALWLRRHCRVCLSNCKVLEMVIAHSPFSCASTRGGNKARETLRHRADDARSEEGWFPSDSKRASPNLRELDSASLHICRAANHPETVKPAIGEEAMSVCTRRDGRGDWRERALRDKPRYPGDPLRGFAPVVGAKPASQGEVITSGRAPMEVGAAHMSEEAG